MNKYLKNTKCHYDYANKCDCSEDDKCGCTYPNNMSHNFNAECFEDDTSPNQYKSEQTPTTFHLTIGTQAPNFTAPAVLYKDTLVNNFNFYQYTNNHHTILFFYPEDFSFTCPSEMLMLNKALNSFSIRKTKIIAISTDNAFSHLAWKQQPISKDGIPDILFPLVDDSNKSISSSYNILNAKGVPLRATIIIDNQKIIRHISLNDNKIWRNPSEYLRILDILNQKTDSITNCPKGWKQNFFFERPEQETITEIYSNRE